MKAHRTGCICGVSPMGDRPCGKSLVSPPQPGAMIVIICAAGSVFIPAVCNQCHFYAPFIPEAYGGMMQANPERLALLKC